MASLLDQLLTVIVGTVSTVTRTVNQTISTLEDFFYVKVAGMSFIVLGARQVGKTTLIEWLKRNMKSIEGFDPDPTAAGGTAQPDFSSRFDEGNIRMKVRRDVGGEYAMWDTDWIELFRESKPRGIVFMMDHTDAHLQKDALNYVMQMLEDEAEARKNLKAFFIVVNKSDLWEAETTQEDILKHYRNEQRRLNSLAERHNFKWAITSGSLKTGKGIKSAMREFLNNIRPSPQENK